MAVLAESLVDEWLNRQGFFTVRGVKHGVEEIDLLGVRPAEKTLDAWHVEVQASFRPMLLGFSFSRKIPTTMARRDGGCPRRGVTQGFHEVKAVEAIDVVGIFKNFSLSNKTNKYLIKKTICYEKYNRA